MINFLIFANKTVNNTAGYLGGIVFDSVTRENQFTEQITYKIRLSSFPRHGRGTGNLNPAKQDKEWFTEFMFPLYQVLGPRDNSSKCGSVPGKTKVCHHSLHTRYCKHITCTFCCVFYLRNKESMWWQFWVRHDQIQESPKGFMIDFWWCNLIDLQYLCVWSINFIMYYLHKIYENWATTNLKVSTLLDI